MYLSIYLQEENNTVHKIMEPVVSVDEWKQGMWHQYIDFPWICLLK